MYLSIIPFVNRHTYFFIIFSLSIAHLMMFQFAFLNLHQVFSNDIIWSYDYSLHFQQVTTTQQFLSQGRWFGYDPYFMGGYLNANLFNVDSKAWALFVYILQDWIPLIVCFKLFIYCLIFSIPLSAYYASVKFDISKNWSFLASGLSIIMFWGPDARALMQWGLISFVAVASFNIYICAALFKESENPKISGIVINAIITGIAFLTHALMPLLVFPSAVSLLFCKKAHLRSSLVVIVSFTSIAIILNIGWIIPFLIHIQELSSSAHPFTLQNYDPLFLFKYFTSIDRLWLTCALVLSSIGVYSIRRSFGQRKLNVFLFPAITFLGIAGFGSFWDVTARLQPVRFIVAFQWMIILPAIMGIQFLLDSMKTITSKKVAAGLFAFTGLLFLARNFSETLNLISPQTKNSSTLCLTKSPVVLSKLLDWVNNRTTSAARLLIEDSGTLSGHRYFGSYFPGLLPYFSRRQLIGGPWPYMFIDQHITDFHDGKLFERPIESYSFWDFQQLAEIYNLGWIICWSDSGKRFFDQLNPWIVFDAQIGDFRTYRINRRHSFVIIGEANVTADYNRISVRSSLKSDDYIVLSYHYCSKFEVIPSGKVEPYRIPGITREFIKVSGFPSDFDLIYKPAWMPRFL